MSVWSPGPVLLRWVTWTDIDAHKYRNSMAVDNPHSRTGSGAFRCREPERGVTLFSSSSAEYVQDIQLSQVKGTKAVMSQGSLVVPRGYHSF